MHGPLERIDRIAARLGLGSEDVEPFSWYAGKLAPGLERRLSEHPDGKYVLVTAVTPTPFGEGKTVTTIGLAMALERLGQCAVPTLRQPSLAPVFGVKGGGAGGGESTLEPLANINLGLTGDLNAVASAHNLLAALVDNHLFRAAEPKLDPATVQLRRVLDVGDRSLVRVTLNKSGKAGPERESGFELTAASEVMAILALATSVADLRERVGRIIVGFTAEGAPVTAEQLGAAGAMAALLRDAVRPNLVQTSENTPALVHAGPFGNIAHGNCSILADLAAVHLADYTVTEAGFGADCGAEKFFDIKCRVSGLRPDAAVLVCSVRALKTHSGRFDVKPGRALPPELMHEDLAALRAGAENLTAHVENVRKFGVPVVVAVNRFPTDSEAELAEVARISAEAGAFQTAVSDIFAHGGAGGAALARAVIAACNEPSRFRYLYDLDQSIEEKLGVLAREIYGADGVDLAPAAKESAARFAKLGADKLPVCVAKTQYSLSHDPKQIGRPKGYRFPIRELRLSAGAGFVYALAGEIGTMPGLPSNPAARRIDLAPDGTITGVT